MKWKCIETFIVQELKPSSVGYYFVWLHLEVLHEWQLHFLVLSAKYRLTITQINILITNSFKYPVFARLVLANKPQFTFFRFKCRENNICFTDIIFLLHFGTEYIFL